MMSELRQVSRAPEIDPPSTPVYGTPIDHPSAWTVADFKTPADYTIKLDAAHRRDIEHAIRQIKTVRGAGPAAAPVAALARSAADAACPSAHPEQGDRGGARPNALLRLEQTDQEPQLTGTAKGTGHDCKPDPLAGWSALCGRDDLGHGRG